MDAAAFQAGLNWRQQGEQKKERAKAEATETQSLRKLMSIYDPENKDSYTSMGLGDLRGSAQAIAVKQHMDELQRQEEERAAEKNFYEMVNPTAPGGVGPDAPVTVNRMIGAAAKSGYRLPPSVLAQAMREGEDGSGFKFDPREIVDLEQYGLPGQVYAPTSKGGGQIRTKFDAASGGIEEMTDDDGNVFKFMTNPKTGARTIVGRPKQAKTLPEAYNVQLNTLLEKIDTSEQNLAKPDAELARINMVKDGAMIRATHQKNVERYQKALRDHVARFKEQGFGDAEFWKGEEERLGLSTPAAAKPASAERVTVVKDGKQFTVPASQLKEAEAQGYKRASM